MANAQKNIGSKISQNNTMAMKLFSLLFGMVLQLCSLVLYRVTHHVGSNLPLTSKDKFRFGLVKSGQARPKWNFCFDVNGRFEPT